MKIYLNRPAAKATAMLPAAIQWGSEGFTDTAKRFDKDMLQLERDVSTPPNEELVKLKTVTASTEGDSHVDRYTLSIYIERGGRQKTPHSRIISKQSPFRVRKD